MMFSAQLDSWNSILKDEFDKEYFKIIMQNLEKEYENNIIFPDKSCLFKAFELCSYLDLKVIIIGQDPYHNIGQANGLAFSVNENVKLPPSLKNIFKELKQSTGIDKKSGDLSDWAKQGVLLLNSVLSVRENKPGSNKYLKWEQFTDNVIRKISENNNNLVFLLWGNYAHTKEQLVNTDKHLILKSTHPSPFSAHRGFFGNNHFIRANNYLKSNNKQEINW